MLLCNSHFNYQVHFINFVPYVKCNIEKCYSFQIYISSSENMTWSNMVSCSCVGMCAHLVQAYARAAVGGGGGGGRDAQS